MLELNALIMILAAHTTSVIALLIYSKVKSIQLSAILLLWLLILPFAGPMMVLVLLSAMERTPADAHKLLNENMARHSLMLSQIAMPDVIPVQDALFLSDAKKRRAIILNVLKEDPKAHLDTLLKARFHEDPETVHYSTATLMVLQKQMQLELQRLQIRLEANQQDDTVRNEYITLLDQYCRSGLMEGQLLRRRRLHLAAVLEDNLVKFNAPELYSMAIDNCLALERGHIARDYANNMLKAWPHDERSWLQSMNVCISTQDSVGLQSLLCKAKTTQVYWTNEGREKMQYWVGRVA